jgi:hypothetical protein
MGLSHSNHHAPSQIRRSRCEYSRCVAMVFVALYLFLSRGSGDYLVRATQMAVIGFIFPNSSAVVKEF